MNNHAIHDDLKYTMTSGAAMYGEIFCFRNVLKINLDIVNYISYNNAGFKLFWCVQFRNDCLSWLSYKQRMIWNKDQNSLPWNLH